MIEGFTGQVVVVGAGRLGSALAAALKQAGASVGGPMGRGFAMRTESLSSTLAVILCVPDREVRAAAATVPVGPLVGHCSGSLALDAIAPHEGFSLHPLMTVTGPETSFRGVTAAVAGTTSRALSLARGIAQTLGMETVEIAESDRAVYHAAASIASNFLVTLESAAERLGKSTGLERRHLAPLARAALNNWQVGGARTALTGPVARGDEETVARQREAVARTAPDLLPLWDAMTAATVALARETASASHAKHATEPS